MTKKLNLICVLIILISILSCQGEEPFNSDKWKQKGIDWQLLDTREKMVSDLIFSDTLIERNKLEIVNLLGEPETSDDQKMRYLIREKYERNIDPEYIKYLLIDLDKEGNAIECYIEVMK